MAKEYKTISEIAGPLIFVEKTEPVGYYELVEVQLTDGTRKRGQVLDTSKDVVVVQIFEGTSGIDRQASVKFLGETIKLSVSREMLGRVLTGSGEPADGGPPILPDKRVDISGAAINPYSREHPAEFIQTGISTIDGLNTLVRGQKLPLFSGAGLPHNEVALQIARQAKVLGSKEPFGVVFAAMGITHEEARVFMNDFERTGALKRAVLFLNLADDPAVERLITPRMALTAAEYLAYEIGMHILVILTDMTNYAEALRQIRAAREEVPGRRGYPGYMYSVDGSRNVVVRDPEGTLRVVAIGKLFREISATAAPVRRGIEERMNVTGWTALGVTRSGMSVFRPIRQIVRHRYQGKLVRLRTRYGETVVTPNHSVFTIRDGRIEPVLAENMARGSLLAQVNRVPTVETASASPQLAQLWGSYVSEGHPLNDYAVIEEIGEAYGAGPRDNLAVVADRMMPQPMLSFRDREGRTAWKAHPSTSTRPEFGALEDSFTAEVTELEWVDPTEEFVYDLCVEDTNNFVDACGGVILHNTDLATIYERAGRIHGRPGSITQIPIASIPDDDWTHPIADLTGYITEGQIAVNRELHRKGIYPPIDPLPSLSRLMDAGIGKGRTREDHKQVSDQLYAAYAEGKDVRGLVAIVGKEALSDRDRKMLEFADRFEQEFIRQGAEEDRTIEQTIDTGWTLLATIDEAWLTKIDRKTLEKYHPKYRNAAAQAQVTA